MNLVEQAIMTDVNKQFDAIGQYQSRSYIAKRKIDILRNDHAISLLTFLLCYTAYYFALANIYVDYVQGMWAFLGFKLEIDNSKFILSAIGIIVISVITPRKMDQPSDYIVLIFLVCIVIPTMVLFQYGGISNKLYILTALTAIAISIHRNKTINIMGSGYVRADMIIFYLFAFSLIATSYIFTKVGFTHFSLDFLQVYDRRDFVNETLIGGLDGYISQYAAQANLIAVVVSIVLRRYKWLAVNFIISALLFGFLGHKAQITWPFIMYIINHTFYRYGPKHIIIALTAITIFTSYVYIYTDDPLIFIAMTFRRMMFIPPMLNQAYLDYANVAGFVYWSDSKIGLGLIEYKDTISIANAVGYYISGYTEMHANTGIIGSGYLQAGAIGVIAYSIVIRLVIAIADGVAKQRDLLPLSTMIILPFIVTPLISSDLPAAFLSGGLGMSLIVLMAIQIDSRGERAPRKMLRKRKPIGRRLRRR